MGGMAEIFRARTATMGFDKRVCIKRVLPHFLSDDDFVTMFRDEAKTAARLQHANVVQVFDFGEVEDDDGRPTLYLAMELVEGLDLRKLADASRKKQIPFTIGEVTQIGIDICRGLHHAHNLRDENGELLGVVHRDISPHNILVSTQGEVKITDFGIAKAAERATHTSTGIVKGKVAYMSPEQAEGKAFDHRLDQWATGVVLWELLCGERLFRGDNDITILRKVLNVEVPAPTTRRHDVPAALEEIILRALSGEPDDRFADMREMELALSRFLFSGVIDPATAEVRSGYARITQGEAGPQARRTGLLPAVALSSESMSTPVAPAPGPQPPTVIRRDEQRAGSTTDDQRGLPKLSMSSDESLVFVSSAKLPVAPRGPITASESAPPTLLVDDAVSLDAAAAAFDLLQSRRNAAAPIVAPAFANDTIELPSLLLPSLPMMPSPAPPSLPPSMPSSMPLSSAAAERSRDQRASPATMIGDGDLVAAAREAILDADTTIAETEDGTPATRTLVPAGGVAIIAPPPAMVVTRNAVDDDDEFHLPRSRAPLIAAMSLLGITGVIGLAIAFGGTKAPTTTTTAPPSTMATTPTTTTAPPAVAEPIAAAAVTTATAHVEIDRAPAEAAGDVVAAVAAIPGPAPTAPAPAAPAPTTAPTTAATPTPTPTTPTKPKAAARSEEAGGAPGSVYVDVPGGWASVAIGKKVYGDTPLTLKLPSGRYTVTLTSGDGTKKKNVPLTVIAGKKVQIKETFN